jgi:hypothetical protein
MDSVAENLSKQWRQVYHPALDDMGVETAYDWYAQETILEEKDGWPLGQSSDSREAVRQKLESMGLGVLYRVAAYDDQPFTIIGRVPEPKIKEVDPEQNEDIEPFKKELQQLQDKPDVSEMDGESSGDVPSQAISEVTTPNWADWLQGHAVNKDGSWSKQFGTLWKELAEVSDVVNFPEQKASYFSTQGSEKGLFDDFYYTNRFKLPWPRGEDLPDVFSKSEINDQFRGELEAVNPDLVVTMGEKSFSMVRNLFEIEAPTGVTESHGEVYEFTLHGEDAFFLPVVHPGYAYSWRDDEPHQTLQESLVELSDRGVI